MNPYSIAKPTDVDLKALAEHNRGVDRAKRAYYGSGQSEEARIRAAEANRRYRARKKGAGK